MSSGQEMREEVYINPSAAELLLLPKGRNGSRQHSNGWWFHGFHSYNVGDDVVTLKWL